MTASDATPAGPMSGLRIIELSHERVEYASKLFADMGADVVKVEPPGGSPTRGYAPFLESGGEGVPREERSLYFWHYNTSKRGVTLDLDEERGRALFRRLAADADMLIEGEAPGLMAALGLDAGELREANDRLIYVSITPFGRSGPRADEAATDLTILAGGGPAWSSGYDDHSLPPVRGGGNQGYHTGCHFAVMSALVALLHRDRTGRGQHIDVNMHAAANITTEAGSYTWLVAQQTVQRQTGRHAAVSPTQSSQVRCADGRWVNSGFPARRPEQIRVMYDWMKSLNLLERFDETAILEIAMARDSIDLRRLRDDEELQAFVRAGRNAMALLAASMPAYDYFTGCQERGFQVGIIYSPEEVIEDPHFVARGFPVAVEHLEVGRTVTYPGAPYRFERSPWQISRRAPLLGEHNDEVYAGLGLAAEEIGSLRRAGAI